MTSMMVARRGDMAQSAFNPASIAGLYLWTDAAQITGLVDGDPVATWADLSGNSRNFTQATSSKRPVYKTSILNGKPVVRFDGVDDLLATATFTLAQPLTVIVAIRPITFNSFPAIYDSNTSGTKLGVYRSGTWHVEAGNDAATTFTPATTTPEVTSVVYDNTASYMAKNGTPGTALGPGTNSLTGGMRIGLNRQDNGATAFNADFAEVLVYSAALSSGNRLAVERYLGTKYGITVA